MQPRMSNPAAVIPEAMKALVALNKAAYTAGVPSSTLALSHLRASQINGCGACVDSGGRQLLKAGESQERVLAVAAWRETPYYTDAERAALELTEAVTRLADRADPVPDEVWDRAAKHFDEKAMAALILSIATTNVFNRLNVSTRQQAGAGW
jgi:AhpD family alkylhydroperoxidase